MGELRTSMFEVAVLEEYKSKFQLWKTQLNWMYSPFPSKTIDSTLLATSDGVVCPCSSREVSCPPTRIQVSLSLFERNGTY